MNLLLYNLNLTSFELHGLFFHWNSKQNGGSWLHEWCCLFKTYRQQVWLPKQGMEVGIWQFTYFITCWPSLKALKCDKSFKWAAFAFALMIINAMKTTILDPIVALMYIEVICNFSLIDSHKGHVILFNFCWVAGSPNYKGFKIICGKDSVMGSYATSIFS